MKSILIVISIAVIFFTESRIYAKEAPKKPEEPANKEKHFYKGSISAVGGITMAGLQGEFTFVPEFGIRIVGLYIFGADFNDMNRDEYIVSGIVAPVLHIAPDELKILDPVLMIGLVYSYHHWETKTQDGTSRTVTFREGVIHDVTFGTGFGILFKYAGRLKTGVNLWLNYDYSVVSTPSMRKKKGDRMILPVPLIEFTVQF